MTLKKKIHAFTLIELMVVLVIVGILAAVGIPSYKQYVSRAKMAEAYSIVDSVQKRQIAYYHENKTFVTGYHYGANIDGNPYITPGGSASPSYYMNSGEYLDDSDAGNFMKGAFPVDGTPTYFQYVVKTGTFNGDGTYALGSSNPGSIGLMFRYSPEYESKTCISPMEYSDFGIIGTAAGDKFSIAEAGANIFPEKCTIIFQTMQAINGEIFRTPMVTLTLALGDDPRPGSGLPGDPRDDDPRDDDPRDDDPRIPPPRGR